MLVPLLAERVDDVQPEGGGTLDGVAVGGAGLVAEAELEKML